MKAFYFVLISLFLATSAFANDLVNQKQLNLGSGVGTALTNAANSANGIPTLDSNNTLSTQTYRATGSTFARTLAAQAADTFNVKNYGAVGDGSTNDGAAIQTAYTAAVAANSVLFFPCGTYKIQQALTATLANLGHFNLVGGGSNCTELFFSGSNTYGFTLNYAGYGTFVQAGMTLTTDQANGGTAEYLNNPNGTANGVEGMDDNNIYDVNFRGHDRYSSGSPTAYWSTGLLTVGVTQLNVWGGSCDFIFNLYAGICYSINGYPTTPVNAVVMNFYGTVANNCGTGFFYGQYVEGMTLNAVNSVNCATSVGTTTGPGTDQLAIVNSQFNAVNCGVCILTDINDFSISNSLFIMSPGAQGAIVTRGSANLITGNDISGVTNINSIGISFTNNATSGAGTIIANNIIAGFTSGIKFAAGISAQAWISNNRMVANTNDFNIGAGAGAVEIFDPLARNLSGIPTCTSSTIYSQFVQADNNGAGYEATAASGGAQVVPIVCNGSNWTNH